MQHLRNIVLSATALLPLFAAPALAGPDGATVVGGQANVQNPGTAHVTVNQFTDTAIINWRMFDIGAGERATFHQPNANAIALNRVTGGMGPTQILGALDANGKVFVINRDGIIFGLGAVITTAGFLATTNDIRNEDFMAGRFNFNIPGRPDASIVNMGTITATNGGFAALVAPGVRNSGTITATLGTVALAAGNTFSLDFYGDKLITLGVGDQIAGQVTDVATGQTLKSLVTNTGALKANGGRVELTAAAARQVVDAVINTKGVIEANTVGTKGGRIVLGAATKQPGLPKQTVKIAGKLTATGNDAGAPANAPNAKSSQGGAAADANLTKGGTIVVTGENIEVTGATIDVTGRDGGGKVLIGGDWGGGNPNKALIKNQAAQLEGYLIPTATTVSIDAATTINASATERGDGGKVVLWADDRMTFAGTILALGGREFGNGGFAEVSGKALLNFTGNVDTRAPNGKAGTLLLDPADFTIGTTTGPNSISNTDLQNQLALGNVTIATDNSVVAGNGDIFVTAPVVWNATTTLTLNAFRNIDVAFVGGSGGAISNLNGGNLVLRADSTGTGIGTVILNAGTNPERIVWGNTGSVSIYYNPGNGYTSPVDYAATTNTGPGGGFGGRVVVGSPSQLTAYMLVNNAANLQNIGVNLAGNYALGRDIDAITIPNFTPIGYPGGQYTGRFDGLGHTISNLTIAPVAPAAFGVSIGLFSTIGATGHVNNLIIDNATVMANPNVTGPGQFVGVLAGTNGGTVSNVHVTNSTVTGAPGLTGVIAGGLVGQNGIFGPGASMGAITLSSAEANVSVGNGAAGPNGGQNTAGGLVGDNPGTITQSTASGNVTGGAFSNVGGLVGRNELGATIDMSTASGNVSVSDATDAAAGGLVGFNFGAITNSGAIGDVTGGNSNDIFKAGNIGGLVGLQDASGTIFNAFAFGAVTAGANSTAGGLVGFNSGAINLSGASGAVSSLDNFAGGLVGFNQVGATIIGSFATGNVSGGGHATGGFAGVNHGTITASFAFGNVSDTSTAHENTVGGFVGFNKGMISTSFAFGNVSGNNAGGFAGSNEDGGTIANSFAGGNVTAGDGGTAGGFVGGNHGVITESAAAGNVTGGANSILGGFAAGNLDGTISDSTAAGSVTSTGPNSVVGGFAGVSTADLTRVTSSGAVTGTSDSYLGGLVGINFAKITDSTSSSSVTGTGAHNVAGGLVGLNFGFIDPSHSTGDVTSGPDSIVGGFVGANAAIRLPDGMQFVGTVSPDSYGTGTATGGPGSKVGPQVGQDYPTAGLPTPPGRTCNHGGQFCGGTLFNPNGTPPTPDPPQPPQPPDNPDKNIPQVAPLLNITAMLVNDTVNEKKQDEVVNTNTPSGSSGGSSSGAPGGQKGGNPAGNNARPPAFGPAPFGLGPLPSGMPPLTETRFLSNEVVMQLGGTISPEDLSNLARRLGLEITYRETIALLGRTVIRFRITGGMAVRDVIAAVEKALGANFSMQPSYAFQLVQDVAQSGAAPADTTRRGDSAQYIVEKLGLVQAHLIATGKNIKVAVIDSEIDSKHPDLEGVITGSYDALPSDDQTPHPHGTGMAGAIASNKRLLGVAPGAQLLGVRAFGVNSAGAQGTSLNIVKGLQWAVDQGAKVINMSFAGPRDPILQQAMKRLTDQGIVLIAAAGNAGPKSPPLYPGADPSVIAVSATDVDDKTYKNANRGKYVAIAAPGVDILVPAPEGGYQLTTGTSVAAAHISGVVALLLERDGSLRPETIRSILSSTAKNVGAPRNDLGSGLVDPVKALSKVGPKSAQLR
jgi:filamentous hemagglutinin family protein